MALVLLATACGSDGSSSTAPSTTSSTAAKRAATTTTDAPTSTTIDEAATGHDACERVSRQTSSSSIDDFRAIAADAPPDVSAGINAVADATERAMADQSDQSMVAVANAADHLADVCEPYGVKLERPTASP